MSEERVLCLFCLRGDARIRIDRRGRPYVSCGHCGTRSFMPSFDALNGYRLLAPEIAALISRFGGVESTLAKGEEATIMANQAVGGGR